MIFMGRDGLWYFVLNMLVSAGFTTRTAAVEEYNATIASN